MKMTEVFILFLACFLFIVGRPLLDKKSNEFQNQQRQEEVSESSIPQNETFRVVFKAKRAEEEPIADIIWLNRAAGIALEKGTPYFNILSQSIHKRFVESVGMELSVVEGTIELTVDPMKSNYDANEITSLSTNEFVE